jgi:malonate transporter MadL subunit
MIIYGVGILSFCYIIGQIIGELLGKLIGIDANVGGVGFAMILLVLINDWLQKKQYLDKLTENGIQFWNQMYIPIVVAMSAIQNVKVAVSSGLIAILAGVVPVILGAIIVPFISKLSTQKPIN